MLDIPCFLCDGISMDKNEQNALQDIEEYGCHVLHIMEEESEPGYTYSIGIDKTSSHPDVIVTGLKHEVAHWMIDQFNNRVLSGEQFKPDEYYSGFLEGFDVTFKEVDKKHYYKYFRLGRRLYKGDDFRALQLIYPSTSGLWPWDKNLPDDYTWHLPRLYKDS